MTASANIRANLDHPLIDGDSHIIEYTPVLMDFLHDAGGSDAIEKYAEQTRGGRSADWYQMNWDERRHHRTMRAPWWALPTKNTYDRCTAMLPKLYHERMDDFGLDFAVLYPTAGLRFPSLPDNEFRPLMCHTYNEYVADCYAPYADRMTPAAAVPMHTPDEGIRELEHAKSLGLKVAMIPSFVRRPVPRIVREHPQFAKQITWLDNYAIDSEYDYDPFWAKCEELGFAVAAHSGGMGFDDRKSVSNYMHNHMGHFAAAGEVLCKGLLMGGATKRFPNLRVALLEGGVVNGSRLYVDIHARWKKRNIEALENMNPANIDLAQAQALFREYGDGGTIANIDRLEETLGINRGNVPVDVRDDFSRMEIETPDDISKLFIPHFYFGCEADDSLAFMAFNRKAYPTRDQVRAIMSFDLGHWDVTDMNGAAAEAYEQLENGLIDEVDFKTFAFSNSVRLYGGANPEFFDGTCVEDEARALLA